jgi:two-component system cell cycle sensor histidine kinase/response regulator CckA
MTELHAQGDDQRQPRGSSETRGRAGERPETVLVVEDEDAVRRLTARTLRSRGYRVIEAASAAEGFRVLADHGHSVDLVLSDVVMPGMNGVDFIENVAADLPGVATMLMSGYADTALADRDEPLAVPFLAKPFTPGDLLDMVRTTLDAPRGS